MSSVDERIVRMKIENSQLLSGVKSSQTALSNLNKSVDQAGKSKGMTALGNTVDTVKHKFSLMNAAALTAVATITNKLVNAGINLVKSFTLDPIIAGFHSYETTINATKTIMANTGASAKTTGKYLQQLQDYANKTVYSFGDMAKNIGTFTAAGVSLKQSTQAIQGVANLAALSGSTSQQASSAMYQLSQALAAGTVHLQDWNSVVNAGMGGKVFQTALANTAVHMGTLDKNMVQLGKDGKLASISGWSFRESFNAKETKGWLTSGVLASTLAQLSLKVDTAKDKAETFKKLVDQGYKPKAARDIIKLASTAEHSATDIKTFSQLTEALGEEVATSWGNVFKTLLGGLGGATKMFSAVHIALENLLRAPVDGLNSILKVWAKFGGRESIFQGFVNIWTAFGKVLHGIGKAWREAFPSSSSGIGKTLANISKGFASLTKSLIPSGSAVADIRDIFKAIFDVLGVGVTIVKDVFGYFASLFGLFIVSGNKGSTGILSMVAAIARMISKFLEFADLRPKIDAFFGALEKARAMALEPIIKTVYGLVSAINPLLRGNWDGFVKQIQNAVSNLGGLGDWVSHIGDGIASLANHFINMGASANPVMRVIIKGMREVAGWLQNAGGEIQDFFSHLSFGNAFDKIGNVGKNLIDGLLKGLDGGSLLKALGDLATKAINFFKSVLGIHSPSTVFAEIGKNIIQGLIVGLQTALTALISFGKHVIGAVEDIGHGAATGWDVFISAMEWIGKALGPIGRVIGAAVGGIGRYIGSLFEGFNSVSFLQTVQLVFSAASIVYLKKFMDSFKNIMDAFKGFGELGEKSGKVLDQTTKNLKTMRNAIRVKMILELAAAIGILAASLWVLAQIPSGKLAISLGAVTTMITTLVGAMVVLNKIMSPKAVEETAETGSKLKDKIGNMFKGFSETMQAAKLPILAASMILMATSLVILAGAVAIFGNMDLETLGKGFGAITLALGLLIGTSTLMSKFAPSAVSASAAILVLSFALTTLAGTLGIYSKISWHTLIDGMLKIALTLTILMGSLEALSAIEGPIIAASFAIGALGLSLDILAGTLGKFAKLSLGEVISSMTKIAIVIGVLAAVGGAAAPALELFGAAMVTIGLGVLAMGAGLALAGVGIAALAAGGTAAFAVIIAGINAFLAALPLMGIQFIAAMTTIVEAIAHAAPKIIDSLVTISHELVRGLVEIAPDIRKAIDVIIEVLLGALVDSSADLINAGVDLIIQLITGIGNASPRMVKAIGDMLINMLNALDAWVNTYAPQISQLGLRIARDLVVGLARGILPKPIFDAISHMVSGMINWFKGLLGIHSPSTVFAGLGRDLIHGLINGIRGLFKSVWGLMKSLGSGLINHVIPWIASLPGKAAHALGSLASTLGHVIGSAFNNAKNIVSSGISNIVHWIGQAPGRLMSLAGQFGKAGLHLIKSFMTSLGHAASSVGGWVGNIVGNVTDAIKSFVNTHIIGWINDKLSFHFHHLGVGFDWSPGIPYLAKGTDSFGGGLAMVGERGAELVSMPTGSSVITNRNLMGFMRAVQTLSTSLSRTAKPVLNRQNGSIIYNVSADFHGDPKASGVAFAANLVSGLANGMKSGQRSVNRATADSAQGLIKTFAGELGIHSPSKIFHGLGINVAKGFVNGILASLNTIKQVGVIMAHAAVNTVAKESSIAQQRADALQAKADAIRAQKQNKAYIKAATKGMTNAQKTKFINGLNAELKAAQTRADKAQGAINSAAARAKEKAREAGASNAENADVFNARAKAAAANAEKKRNEALKLQIEADRVRQRDPHLAKQLHDASVKAMKAAVAAGKAAKTLAEKADTYSKKVVQAKTSSLKDQLLLDTGTPEQIAEYWNKKKDDFKQTAADSFADAKKAIAAAQKAKDAGDITEEKKQNALAAAALAKGELYTQKAQDAADAAGQAAESASSSAEAIQALKMPQMTVSSNAVHGAQSMFDAYSKSLAAVTNAAAQPSVTVNLEQNNNSPQSLSASEIYRNTKNILSTTERKLNSVLTG